MKKIFTFLAGVLISIGMQAVDQISMGKIEPWSPDGKMQVAEGNVITFDVGSSWVGGQYWFEDLDLRAYDYLCVEIEDCQGDFAIAIDYQDNTNKEYSFSSGTTQVTFKLHSELITKLSVKNTSNGGTLDIGNLYAGSAAEFETALDLDNLNTGWNSEYDVTTHTITYADAWGAKGWWLGETDYSQYVKLVVEFAQPLTCGGYLDVEYNNDIATTSTGLSVGLHSAEVPFNQDGANSVKQIIIKSDTKDATITLAAVYLVRDVMQIEDDSNEDDNDVTTDIANTNHRPTTANGTYNIMGCAVAVPSAPGFYIINGQKILVIK